MPCGVYISETAFTKYIYMYALPNKCNSRNDRKWDMNCTYGTYKLYTYKAPIWYEKVYMYIPCI